MTEENLEKAGVFALICSFIMPIVGVICYFVNKSKVENASAYLWAALAGVVVGFILNLASTAILSAAA